MPASVIGVPFAWVTADSVYFQCPKALVRSRLWSPEAQVARSELPSSGDVTVDLMDEASVRAMYEKIGKVED